MTDTSLTAPSPTAAATGGASSLFVRAARREATERTPVWFMRQAGRFLPEYRAVRERFSLIEICRQPELCAEVTMQPLRRMPLDGAVLFSDIMIPLLGAGVELDIVEGTGPVIARPVRDRAGVEALRRIEPERDLPYVTEAVRILAAELHSESEPRALIGFSGAPFTLASYLVEGRPTRDFLHTKRMMYAEPELWDALCTRLAEIAVSFLRAQVENGADVLQLFDSWIGALAPDDYVRYVQPYTRRILAELAPLGVPLIHFGVHTGPLLEQMKDDGATVIGLDWRVPLDEGWARVGHHLGVQGNLDPAALHAPREVLEAKADDVLRRAGARPGHIFNLGHGILPSTPIDQAQRLVDFVHERSAELRAGGTAGVASGSATGSATVSDA